VQFTGTVMNFLAVPLVAMEGYSAKFILFPGATPLQKTQIWLGSVNNKQHPQEENCNFWLYVTFDCRGFAENSYLSLYIHPLKMFILFFRSIITTKLLEEECSFFCVSWLLLEVHLRIHVFHFTLFRQNKSKFYCDPSVIIITLPEQQCTFLSDSPLPGNGFS
jgi:hypothetical protein